FQYALRMRYAAQVLDVEVSIAPEHLQGDVSAKLTDRFATIYTELFGAGSGDASAGIRITDTMLHATVTTPKPQLHRVDAAARDVDVSRTTRDVYWADARTTLPTEVIRLESGVVAGQIHGPALIELPDTVVVVAPTNTAHFDEFGNLIVDIG